MTDLPVTPTVSVTSPFTKSGKPNKEAATMAALEDSVRQAEQKDEEDKLQLHLALAGELLKLTDMSRQKAREILLEKTFDALYLKRVSEKAFAFLASRAVDKNISYFPGIEKILLISYTPNGIPHFTKGSCRKCYGRGFSGGDVIMTNKGKDSHQRYLRVCDCVTKGFAKYIVSQGFRLGAL